tara:strand:- start:1682 stop:1900 length:219 start_codon:yes stop_codon:yes gene_type:complete
MNLDILILDNYNLFVWPAFIFVFTICSYFYFKTKKTLQEQEKLFLKEFDQNKVIKVNTLNTKNNTTEVLSGI